MPGSIRRCVRTHPDFWQEAPNGRCQLDPSVRIDRTVDAGPPGPPRITVQPCPGARLIEFDEACAIRAGPGARWRDRAPPVRSGRGQPGGGSRRDHACSQPAADGRSGIVRCSRADIASPGMGDVSELEHGRGSPSSCSNVPWSSGSTVWPRLPGRDLLRPAEGPDWPWLCQWQRAGRFGGPAAADSIQGSRDHVRAEVSGCVGGVLERRRWSRRSTCPFLVAVPIDGDRSVRVVA